jgi:hypothetical protein
MQQGNFYDLLEDICRLANIAEPDRFREKAQLVIDGTTFSLLDSADFEAGTIAYFCDFGPVPDTADRADILLRLLQRNLLMAGVRTPSFAMNYETGMVQLIGRSSLKEVDAITLLNAFAQYAKQAAQWRQTYFLDPLRRTKPKSQPRLLGMPRSVVT